MKDIKLNKADFEKYYDKALAWVSKHHSKIANYNQLEGYIVGVMKAMKRKEAR